jgi:hypothetical protein
MEGSGEEETSVAFLVSKTFSGKFCIALSFIFCFAYLSPSCRSTAAVEAVVTAAILAEVRVNPVSLYSFKISTNPLI